MIACHSASYLVTNAGFTRRKFMPVNSFPAATSLLRIPSPSAQSELKKEYCIEKGSLGHLYNVESMKAFSILNLQVAACEERSFHNTRHVNYGL
ncbi:hypothetical protein TNCV_3425171 [Trichonephila clavipes]|nr:hypothetical protein TNCV_3425171 [Trichonephila clavipes]